MKTDQNAMVFGKFDVYTIYHHTLFDNFFYVHIESYRLILCTYTAPFFPFAHAVHDGSSWWLLRVLIMVQWCYLGVALACLRVSRQDLFSPAMGPMGNQEKSYHQLMLEFRCSCFFEAPCFFWGGLESIH